MGIRSVLEWPQQIDHSFAYEKRIKRVAEPYWRAMGVKLTPVSQIEDIDTDELNLSMARRLAHVSPQALAEWFGVLVHMCERSSPTCATLAGPDVISKDDLIVGLAHLPDNDIATWFRVPSSISEGKIDLGAKAVTAREIYAFLGALAGAGGREGLASRALLASEKVLPTERCMVLRAVLAEAQRRPDESGVRWKRYIAGSVLALEPVFY